MNQVDFPIDVAAFEVASSNSIMDAKKEENIPTDHM